MFYLQGPLVNHKVVKMSITLLTCGGTSFSWSKERRKKIQQIYHSHRESFSVTTKLKNANLTVDLWTSFFN